MHYVPNCTVSSRFFFTDEFVFLRCVCTREESHHAKYGEFYQGELPFNHTRAAVFFNIGNMAPRRVTGNDIIATSPCERTPTGADSPLNGVESQD